MDFKLRLREEICHRPPRSSKTSVLPRSRFPLLNGDMHMSTGVRLPNNGALCTETGCKQ